MIVVSTFKVINLKQRNDYLAQGLTEDTEGMQQE